MPYAEIRQQVWETVRKLSARGLIRLSAGNISARTGDGHIAITPSGVHYDRLQPEDIVIVDADGRLIDGRGGLRPSSEFRLHTALLASRPDAGAVVHTHSVYALTFAALGREIPLVSVELVAAGGPIPVAPYACPGTPAVGEGAAAVFRTRPELMGLLLQNHGLVALGPTLDKAYEIAYDVEVGAEVAYRAMLLGEPATLTPAQAAEIRAVYAASRQY